MHSRTHKFTNFVYMYWNMNVVWNLDFSGGRLATWQFFSSLRRLLVCFCRDPYYSGMTKKAIVRVSVCDNGSDRTLE